MEERDEGTGESKESVESRKLVKEAAKEIIRKLDRSEIAHTIDFKDRYLAGYIRNPTKEQVDEIDKLVASGELKLQFNHLLHKNDEYKGLDGFDKPDKCTVVAMTSDEVTAVCPVTNQPDYYTVEIRYAPIKKCIESKSLKLFLGTFRNKGIFCEALANVVLDEIVKACAPLWCQVTVVQKPRGGISIEAKSVYPIGGD